MIRFAKRQPSQQILAHQRAHQRCAGVRRYARFGALIIEMLLLISVSSVLLTVVAIWLHKMMLFSSNLTERQRDHISLNHLASQLRQDVMLAKDWSFPDPKEPNHLELVLADDSRIQYRLVHEDHGSKIHAIHLPATIGNGTPAQPASNGSKNGLQANPIKKPARQEVYRFSPGCKLKWQSDEFPQALVLAVSRVPMLANPLPKPGTVSNLPEPRPEDQSASTNHPVEAPRSTAPVETLIRLQTNRWAGRINRVLGESP